MAQYAKRHNSLAVTFDSTGMRQYAEATLHVHIATANNNNVRCRNVYVKSLSILWFKAESKPLAFLHLLSVLRGESSEYSLASIQTVEGKWALGIWEAGISCVQGQFTEKQSFEILRKT